MRWRKAAAAGGAALGAAALYNVSATQGIGDLLENQLGGESCEMLWRGHQVAFTRHGQGAPVLLVHGLYAGASSIEWRHTVDVPRRAPHGLHGRPARIRPLRSSRGALHAGALPGISWRHRRAGRRATPAPSSPARLSAAHLVALAARDPRPHRLRSRSSQPTGVAHLRDRDDRAARHAPPPRAPLVGNYGVQRASPRRRAMRALPRGGLRRRPPRDRRARGVRTCTTRGSPAASTPSRRSWSAG